MRTTIDIPEDLLEEARRVSNSRTKRDAVLAGLQELIRRANLEDLRRLPGKIPLNLDLYRKRKSKH
jgi:hypothetical protein